MFKVLLSLLFLINVLNAESCLLKEDIVRTNKKGDNVISKILEKSDIKIFQTYCIDGFEWLMYNDKLKQKFKNKYNQNSFEAKMLPVECSCKINTMI